MATAQVHRGSNARLGNVYLNLDDYPQTLEYYRKALATSQELGNKGSVAVIIGNLGLVYSAISDYPAALDHYQRALELHIEVGNHASVARVTGRIGSLYADTGDYALAVEHYNRAIAIHEEVGDRMGVAHVIANIGNVYSRTGDYPRALEQYRRALEVHQELDHHASVVLVTGNMVTVLLKMNNDDEAERLLNEQGSMTIDTPALRGTRHSNEAELAIHRGDMETALSHLQQAHAIANETGARAPAAEIHERLRDLAQKRNDFAGYIEHNNEHHRISEEIRGKEATQRMAMMEAERRIESVERERDKERAILYSTLPKHIADRMVRGEKVSGDHFDNASVMFIDIVGFTKLSDSMPARNVVLLLEQLFTQFDEVCKQNNVVKIKTIGDSYLAVAMPDAERQMPDKVPNAKFQIPNQLVAMANAALQIIERVKQFDSQSLQVRIGIHCGPVTAGVIGTERLQYDVWGDTVNVASRMESTSEPNRIHVSEQFANAISDERRHIATQSDAKLENETLNNLAFGSWQLALRGLVDVKGKGPLTTYWLDNSVA